VKTQDQISQYLFAAVVPEQPGQHARTARSHSTLPHGQRSNCHNCLSQPTLSASAVLGWAVLERGSHWEIPPQSFSRHLFYCPRLGSPTAITVTCSPRLLAVMQALAKEEGVISFLTPIGMSRSSHLRCFRPVAVWLDGVRPPTSKPLKATDDAYSGIRRRHADRLFQNS